MPEATRDALRELCKSWNEEAAAFYQKGKKRGNTYIKPPPTLTSKLADKAWRQLRSWVYPESSKPVRLIPQWGWGFNNVDRQIRAFLERPEIEVIHFVRLMVLLRLVRPTGGQRGWMHQGIDASVDPLARHYRKAHPPAFGLRELAAALRAVGIDDRFIGLARLHSTDYQRCFSWEDEAVWPYFAEHLDLLEEVFELRPRTFEAHAYLRTELRRNAFQALAAFPSLPALFHRPMWEIALGNYFPEENRTVALRSLYFVPTSKEETESGYAWRINKLRLGEIPAVLLAECWNDLRNLSALGSGFDPDWEKKSEW